MKRGCKRGIDLFICENGAYTTVAAAVSMLVVLTLVFSSVSAIWVLNRSSDTQTAADVTALSGSNVVASYHTVATVMDACALSMGLAGFALCGAGFVGLLIPSLAPVASSSIDTGVRLLDYRNSFITSASRGLATLEDALPFLVAAAGTKTAAAQKMGELNVTGTALAVPRTSDSQFPALKGLGIATDGLSSAAQSLEEIAKQLDEATQQTQNAKRAAWLADCGRDGYNMQERAARLTALDETENPDYASSITWDPAAGIMRSQAYYTWRSLNEEPTEPGLDGEINSEMRRIFYLYAADSLQDAFLTESASGVSYDVPLLPGNVVEMRTTKLYTEPMWPTTIQGGITTIHYSTLCAAATGTPGPYASLQQAEAGSVATCDGPSGCNFSVTDLGRMPAASTNIDNGYEYHLREYTYALEGYVKARNNELKIERQAQDKALGASQSFEEALGQLSAGRPVIAPPGRYGVVALVSIGELVTPDTFDNGFTPSAVVPARGAISAAVLAPDAQTTENNVLSSFFQSLESRTGEGGPVGLVDDVMDFWGSVLISYGDVNSVLGDVMHQLVGNLDSLGAGPLARQLSSTLDGIIRTLGLKPVDLRLRKSVLTNSSNVMQYSDNSALVDLQESLRSIPLGSRDPKAIARALAYDVGERFGSATITVAELTLPGGISVPLTINVGQLLGMKPSVSHSAYKGHGS